MAGILFDTSVYISAFRKNNLELFSQRSLKPATADEFVQLWLSSVVLEELYVGARNVKAWKLLEKLERDFERANRILVPNKSDWANAGKTLNKIGEKYSFDRVGKARLTNDTLIAMSVARNGITLLTANKKDFVKISEFRELNWILI